MEASNISARVMVKPDGLRRVLSQRETAAVVATWNSLLEDLLRSSTDTPRAALIGELPSIIAGRQGYRAGYDLDTWRSQASACSRLSEAARSAMSVHDLHSEMFESLDLKRYKQVFGVLSEEEVSSIYRPSQWYAEDPGALTEYMRSGPVAREMWCGKNVQISLLVKFAIRSALNIEGRYNLVHCDLVAQRDARFQ